MQQHQKHSQILLYEDILIALQRNIHRVQIQTRPLKGILTVVLENTHQASNLVVQQEALLDHNLVNLQTVHTHLLALVAEAALILHLDQVLLLAVALDQAHHLEEDNNLL